MATPDASPPPHPATGTPYPPTLDLLGPVRFGGFGIEDPDRPWRYRATAELVALLIIRPEGLTVERAGDLITDGARHGRQAVQRYACQARKVLGQVLPTAGPSGRYVLDLDRMRCDLLDFARLTVGASHMPAGPDRLQARLDALALVRGPVFDGALDGWHWADADEAEISGRIEATALAASVDAIDLDRPADAVTACRAGLRALDSSLALLAEYGRAALAAEAPADIGRAWALMAEAGGADWEVADVMAQRPTRRTVEGQR